MSAPGRPKREYRSAQHERSPMTGPKVVVRPAARGVRGHEARAWPCRAVAALALSAAVAVAQPAPAPTAEPAPRADAAATAAPATPPDAARVEAATALVKSMNVPVRLEDSVPLLVKEFMSAFELLVSKRTEMRPEQRMEYLNRVERRLPELDAALRRRFLNAGYTAEYERQLIKGFAENLSTAELIELRKFNESALGQTYLHVMPLAQAAAQRGLNEHVQTLSIEFLRSATRDMFTGGK